MPSTKNQNSRNLQIKMKIAVGSKNPIKIKAVEQAFKKVWPRKKWQVLGLDISSGVSSQPMSDAESIKGATNRAKGALEKSKADFGVGIEGGLHSIGTEWFDTAWIVVISKNGDKGIGSTYRLQTPKLIMKMIKKGLEIGEANDKIFNLKNSKQKAGHFGLMTNGIITRSDAYTYGIICALSRFIVPAVFDE